MAGRQRKRLVALAVGVLALAPFFVALGAAVHDGWRPMSDDGAIAVLSHDVFSTRTPLVGMPSSVGESTTVNTNGTVATTTHHPGPLLFWTLAPLEWVTRSAPIGLLTGAVLVNIGAVALLALLMRRIAGDAAALAALVIVVVMTWGLGRQTIVDIWNPHLAIFPAFALMVSTWAVLVGRARAFWAVAFLASFVVQAHLLYGPIALAMFTFAAAGVAYAFVQRAEAQRPWKREAVLVGSVGAAILAAVWLLPVVDQIIHSPGNFTAVGESLHTNTGKPAGLSYALRVVTQSIAFPPLFARQGAGIGIVGVGWSTIGPLGIVSALVVLGALGAGLVVAIRRRDRVAATGGGLAVVALLVGVLTIARVPLAFPEPFYYRLLEVWSIGAFVWLATGVVGVRAVAPWARRWPASTQRAVRIAAAALAACVLLAGPIAIGFADSHARDDPRLYRAVGALAGAVAPHLEHGQAYEVDAKSSSLYLAGSVQFGLLRELLRRGYNARVPASDPYLSRSHAASPGDARVFIQAGAADASTPPAPGARRLGQVDAATPADRAALASTDDAFRRYLRDPANLTAAGQRARADATSTDAGAVLVRKLIDPASDPITLWYDGSVGKLVFLGLLKSNVIAGSEARRFTNAHELVEQDVFTAWLIPATANAPAG